jgi:hypothetical protein
MTKRATGIADPANLWAQPISLNKINLSQVSTHGLDPTGLKWRRPEIAHIIQDESFVTGMEAAMTPQVGFKLPSENDTVPGFTSEVLSR